MEKFSKSEIRQYTAGEVVIKEGDRSEKIFLIISGQVEVTKLNEHHAKVYIATLDEGEIFGELGVIQDRKRQATVTAKTNLVVEIINPVIFEKLLDTEVGRKVFPIMQSMAERIRQNGNRLTELEPKTETEENLRNQRYGKLLLVADSRRAVRALNGMSSVEIKKFPFHVGRYSQKRSDGLFHRNNLYLQDKAPYNISRSHFVLQRSFGTYYFQDQGSATGSIVNKEKIGSNHSKRKVILASGENIVYLGPKDAKIKFKIII